MRKSRFTETQIVSILKSADAGKKVKDLCREHGISDATYYKWKSKYGGMEASVSWPTHSRLKSSITLRIRKRRPQAS